MKGDCYAVQLSSSGEDWTDDMEFVGTDAQEQAILAAQRLASQLRWPTRVVRRVVTVTDVPLYRYTTSIQVEVLGKEESS